MKKNILCKFLKNASKTLFIALAFTLFIGSVQAQTFTDPEDLVDAVNAAGATGGTFILENDSYSNAEFGISVVATAAKPIIIKAATVGGVTLTGASFFTVKKSAYVTVEGFVFDNTSDETLVKLEGSHHIRISRNVFKTTLTPSVDASSEYVYIGGVYNDDTYPYINPSHHNRIDHNIFKDKNVGGHYVVIDGNNEADQSQNDQIDHNYFKDNTPRAINEKESVRIGWSNMSKSSGFTTVEYNLFENCDGDPEVVSVKSSDNVVRHNTFNGNYGTLSFRHGDRNRAEGNYFFGNGRPVGLSPDGADLYTGGIRAYGSDHVIINNYFEGLNGTKWDAPITITQGDVYSTSTSLTSHFRPERMIIAYNTLVGNDHGIEIGYDNVDKYGIAPKDITITNNLITGSKNSLVEIIDSNDPGSAITWSNNLMYPTGTALTVSGGTTTTSFTTAQAVNENPNLVYDSAQKTWRSSATTPIYTNSTAVANMTDIDGQTRPAPSNVGADHFSAESVRYMPMTATTVGPDAYETDVPLDELALSSITTFAATGGDQTTTVTSNGSWTATVVSAPSWVTISPTSGSNGGSITITAAANTNTTTRSAILSVVVGTLTRSLLISQAAYVEVVTTPLINTGTNGNPVSVTATIEQGTNYATNTLDNVAGTKWSDDGKASTGAYGVLTYDLGGYYDLDFIKLATTGTTTKFYTYSFQFSTNGTDYTAPVTVVSASDVNTVFATYDFNNTAVKYIKVNGGGNSGTAFSTISEIDFYGFVNPLSVSKHEANNKIVVYPNPIKNELNVQASDLKASQAFIYSLDGRLVLSKKINNSEGSNFSMDVSSLTSGNYVLQLVDDSAKSIGSKKISVSK